MAKKNQDFFLSRRGFYKDAFQNGKFFRRSHRSLGTRPDFAPKSHEKGEYPKWSKKVEVIVQGIKRQAATDKRPFLNVKACHSLPRATDPGWKPGLMSLC